jgi:hypothetical protein
MRTSNVDRFGELARYLVDHRVCTACSKTFAAAAVKDERGERPWVTPEACAGPADARGCREIARSVWPGRPGVRY